MEDNLYGLMDWAGIEAVVYSEEDRPHDILGPHLVEEGLLIQAYIPSARDIKVRLLKTEKIYSMIREEEGFFAVLIPKVKRISAYTFIVTYDNGVTQELTDPYFYGQILSETDLNRFSKGIHYNIYEKLGAHPMEINGASGVYFAVWAPNAVRVSVVGDFNCWDGRRHPMSRLKDSGIFELFIPGLLAGEIYKYEIKVKGGMVVLKADPYANRAELRPNNASVVCDLNGYQWGDSNWLSTRKSVNYKKAPVNIYELHLGSFKKPGTDEREFYNYRELAPMVSDYILEMGYTHVELMPVMEHPFDGSWGYQVTGYYAPTARYGSPEDFMYFIDFLHQKGIGIILDWVPAHFPKDSFGLATFDGTCLYEHLDPRQGSHPHWGTLIYNYGRPQVSLFLIANALFWIEKYHADGIRMDAVASMLYLDYGKKDGEWIANKYGGKENLEAMEMLKHLNSIVKKRKDGAMLIAEESTSWPKVTGDLEEGGLGFDLKWNMGWMNDFTNYMKSDPLFRKGRHGELTFSMVYAYSEKFILVLSHDEVVHGKGSMIQKMPGNLEDKFANLRTAYGFMMCHPGKKLLFMGQEFAQYSEWDEKKEIDWKLLKEERNASLNQYVKELNSFYRKKPALYAWDFEEKGFEWISSQDADHSIVVFVRKADNIQDTLLVVCNFTPVVYENFLIGVPFPGKYKEIFSSDYERFGGKGHCNKRMKPSKHTGADGRMDSLSITVPPLGISIFSSTPLETTKESSKRNSRRK
ncbi:1,4-alpha-glucan branching enzyme [Anaerocolumna jejuensis DSM 15929]|uniref:1,4-alpha-glucan branching enzyme GlgB n=1 Tax=Anaerocolumna jejuensis DSM 15929 TaxID=1121322 RepID=A0A1M6WPZ8_9FIRM|nr:1,4-alpha-glucan branching protein GlgB [Anaerocolumna jejuensis]SHK95768.1 1,4-alpha-glucan branching enzyme [Anaerocolumna jejuensis DSM 15929]